MSDKLLHNRLDSLFADLEEINELPAPIQDSSDATGWTFSCDSAKQYIDCSPEIGAILGIPAAEFLGKDLPQFALTKESALTLEAVLEAGEFPKDLELGFISARGVIILVNLHLKITLAQDSSAAGYSGFTQVLDQQQVVQDEALRSEPSPDRPAEQTSPESQERIEPSAEADDQPTSPLLEIPDPPTLQPASSDAEEAQLQRDRSPAALPPLPETAPEGTKTSIELKEALDFPSQHPSQAASVVDRQQEAEEEIDRSNIPSTEEVDLTSTELWLDSVGPPVENLDTDIKGVEETSGTFADEPEGLTLKTLPDLSGSFPDAAPDAFQTLFPGDKDKLKEPDPDIAPPDSSESSQTTIDLSGESPSISASPIDIDNDADLEEAVQTEPMGFEGSNGDIPDTADTDQLDLKEWQLQETTIGPLPGESEASDFKDSPETPDLEPVITHGGETRPFDHLDTLIATLPHAISDPPTLEEKGPPGEKPGTDRKNRPHKGTGILRLSEAIPSPGTDIDPAVLTVPIHMQERSIGLLEIIDETPYRDWSEDDRRLVEEIADQLSLALENARLFAQTQKALDETESQAHRLARLNEMSEHLSRTSHLDEVFTVAGRKTAAIIPSDRVSLTLTEDDKTQDFLVTALYDVDNPSPTNGALPLEKAAIQIAIQERILVNLPNSQENGHGDLSAVMVAPLLASGKLTGTINVGKKLAGGFSKQDETLLLQVASLLASTIEGRRLFEQTEQALSETEALFQAGAELNAVQTYDDILTILRRYTIIGEQARHASVFLFDRPWQGENIPTWQIRITHWSNSPAHNPARRLPLSEWEPAAEILHQEVPTIIPEIRANPALWADDSPMKAELGSAKSALIIPLNVGRQWIGYIFTSYAEPRDFPGVNIRRLTSLAGQAAIAIENLRLLEETMSRARQLQTAAEIARDASETLAVEELLNRAVNLIASRFGFYHTSIYLLDEAGENAVIWASAGQTGPERVQQRQFPVGSKSVVGYVTQTGPLVLNDVRQSPIHEPNPDLPETRAELGIPLKVGERIIGALDVQSKLENPFTQDDVAVLQTLTDQIAVAVDNARSYEVAQDAIQEARQRLQELSMLYSVSQSFASAPLEIAEIANLVARQFVKLLRVPECSVSTLDDTNKALGTLVAIRIDDDGEFIDLEDVGRIVPVSDYPGAEHALATLNPLVVNLSGSDVGDPAMQATLIRDGYSSQVIIPLAAKGQPIGIIELKSRGDERLTTPGELNLAMTLANQAAVALENASLYNEQRRTADQLREVDILKTQFLANMSHELRTPLNSIIGFSRVILKGIDGPVTNLQEQDLTAIYNAGQHLLGLINDILDLSKIEAGKMELSFEIINLVDLINSVMSTAVGLVKHKRIQLLKDLPKDLPPVNADPLRIRQVLLNLLSNAAKFTEEGSITVSAVLQDADKDGNQSIMVRVTDTGPGISPEDQNKLFQPFTQVDASPTRKTGGSGLGLSISLHLIEMHKGHIGVESEMEVGSTFYFSLQAVDPEELDGQVPRPINYIRQTGPLPALTEKVYDKKLILKETGELTMPAESYEQPKPLIQTVIEPSDEPIEVHQKREITNGPLILAVDKDPQIVALYDRYLNPGGYQVIPASDAEQALVFARANQPTLITLDVMANQYDGWQLLKDLKEDPVTQDIPVIVCSILEERDKAHELGASDYLVKPILETDLIDAVEQLVNQGTPGQPREDQVLQAIEVLIVDQDPADIRVLEMLLEENGNFQISEAGDGRQALEAILTDQPDVIILNHLLPDMDAVTFIRTLRANPTIRDLPIILLTETELPEVMKQQLARNCKAIFHKAKINPEALLTNLLGATG